MESIRTFREDDLEAVYSNISADFGLPVGEARSVMTEVESHTGLVQQSGHRQYDFVHLVIQEFLTAMHAHRKANAISDLIPRYPNEMALVVAYSTGPEDYLEQILDDKLFQVLEGTDVEFLTPFLGRLAIERPVWRPTASSGWVFLALFDLVARHLLQVDPGLQIHWPTEVAKLLSDDAVATAMLAATREADRFEIDSAFRLIPKSHNSAPTAVRRLLDKRADAGFLLLKSDKTVQRLFRRSGSSRHKSTPVRQKRRKD
jgi:hypothetical protein